MRKLPWLRKAGVAGWLALWPVLALVARQPVRDTPTRLLLLAGTAILWGGALLLLRRRPWACRAHLAVTLAVTALLLLPGRPYDRSALRAGYVQALLSYEGVPYVWGGETRRGIDCSGLVRRALADAAGRQGLRTANPALVRLCARTWAVDCSAHDLGDGWRGQLRKLFDTPSLNAVDYSRLLPGDVAVTRGGAHTLAYVGNRTWIEADPNRLTGDCVIRVRAPADNGWFSVPMTILRWRALE